MLALAMEGLVRVRASGQGGYRLVGGMRASGQGCREGAGGEWPQLHPFTLPLPRVCALSRQRVEAVHLLSPCEPCTFPTEQPSFAKRRDRRCQP